MVKSKVKNLLIILLATVIIAILTNVSFAANDTLASLLDENTTIGVQTNNTVNSTVNNTTNNTVNNIPVMNVAGSSNTSTNQQSTLPQTGESDIYIVSVLIAVFATVTIYAYKKIRYYNGL